MNPSHCPLCYGELDVRDVAPRVECGGLEQELEHRDVEPEQAKDKFCAMCGHRLTYLELVVKARELHASGEAHE